MGRNQQYEQPYGAPWRCGCGQVNAAQDIYCSNCGGPQSAGVQIYEEMRPAGMQNQPAAMPVPPPEASPPRKKVRWLLPALVLLVIAAIAVTLLLWAPWKDKSQPVAAPAFTPAGGVSVQSTPAAEPAAEAEFAEEVEPAAAEEPANPYAGVYEITVWASAGNDELILRQIEQFNTDNSYGITIQAAIVPVSEADVSSMFRNGYAADLFVFPSDQLRQLKDANALAPLSGDAAAFVKENNDAGSAGAAELDGTVYAYPITSDNGYFLYYDKAVISDSDAKSVEKILADCEAAGKSFSFEVSSAWYGSSFFFGAGCISEWELDSYGRVSSVRDNFASSEGLIALRGMQRLVQSPAFRDSSTTMEFYENAAAVVSGTWDYNTAKAVLGDNLGIAELPSFTVDGKSYHLGSFAGFKLLGVRPQLEETRAFVLDLLARHLSGERCQIERFETLNWLPSNRNAQQNPSVIADPALAALLRQSAYAHVQGEILGNWWMTAGQLSGKAQAAATEDADELLAILSEYSQELETILNGVQNKAAGWCVIGSVCGTSWDMDFPMIEVEPGVYQSQRMSLHAGEELKVRKNWSWEENFGVDGPSGENLVVNANGEYYVILDENAGTIYLSRG